MIQLFLKQYIPWICFTVLLQLFLNLILYVDKGFQSVSFIYMNFVWFILFFCFLIWRYAKDRKHMKDYEGRTGDYLTVVHEDYMEQLSDMKVEVQEQKLIVLEHQDELLAWVHEMKSPLTAMQLLVEKVDNAELKERIENEWLRLYLLLDQQLHATRLLTIEQDNRIEKISVKDVIVNEVKALRSWCFEKNLAIELKDVDVFVLSDAKWLGFITRQILSNAVKYSYTGGEIRLFTTNEDGQVVLQIEDDGVGIKREDLPRVFRKSYTGTIGRETSAATGMGLYLAKQAADSLHLKLAITSTEMAGTTVKIYFPQQNDYIKTFAM